MLSPCIIRISLLVGLACTTVPFHFSGVSEQTIATTTQGARQEVAHTLASQLATNYLFPDTGRRYAEALKQSAKGDFVTAGSDSDYAERLTELLQSAHADPHIRVTFEDANEQPATAKPNKVASPEVHGFEVMGFPSEDIAYIRFNLFPGDADTLAQLDQFIGMSRGVDNLIIDLRGHRGGGLAEMDRLFAELFVDDTPLLFLDAREAAEKAGRNPISDGPSLLRVDAPEGIVRRLHRSIPAADPAFANTKLWVLVSGYTASAAEHLAFVTKRTGRGRVLGAATRGGAHFGGTIDLGHGYHAFVPVGRGLDPDTGHDWEGEGVAPDDEVEVAQALTTALVEAGMSYSRAQRASEVLFFPIPEAPERQN